VTIVLGIILSLVAVVSAAAVIGGAVWAAKKDGEADRALRQAPEDADRPPGPTG
jgi:hypothetical protein